METRNLRRSVAKRDRLLTVLGALVIFVTFIVKEIYRDSARDLGIALQAARTTFAIRDEVEETTRKVDEVGDVIIEIYAQGKGQRPLVAGLTEVQSNLLLATGRMQRWLPHIVDFEKSLPEGQLHCASDISRDVGQLQMETFRNPSDADQKFNKILLNFDACQKGIVTAVSSAEQKARLREIRFGYASIALFVIGWALTLIGKLTKDEKAEGIEADD